MLSFTCTVVVELYLKDLVWPFSRKTFSTFAIGGMRTSLSENADGCFFRDGERATRIQKREIRIRAKRHEMTFVIHAIFDQSKSVHDSSSTLTGNKGDPFTQTDSANLTRIGLALSLLFFAGDSSVDFRPVSEI